MRVRHVSRISRAVAVLTATATLLSPVVARADEDQRPGRTPIKHVIVIFQENVSFDHYFATYPHAENLPGEAASAVPARDISADRRSAGAGLMPDTPVVSAEDERGA
jgi:phospholipase C